ncbi:hypothetical protein [Methanosphaera sp. WGK6]|uniref:hypothetical protein n=1 Tax=Methanosphaera sp. WGK6 TaxID=1561964 RepID=UPI00084C4F72|nr:hypothetical protein [Methanosphaera sp. WGK6]OED29834.1 hypothetical protein NL43_05965 [Methanosphaera sp. WGK6]
MRYIDINGKFIRKDPKYYLQDVLEFPEYTGNIDEIYDFLIKLDEEIEIHFINTTCMTPLLMEIFEKACEDSDNISFYIDD